MRRETELAERLHSLTTLREAVSAMKSLAAHHFRTARAALEPARTYRSDIETMVRSTGAWLPAGEGERGLLVVGAELGLCGAYNARMAEDALGYRQQLGNGPTFCIGHRLAVLLERHGLTVDRQYASPTSVQGITDVLLKVAKDMLSVYVSRNLSAFRVASAVFEGVGAQRSELTPLLPLDITPEPGAATVCYTKPDQMAAVAVRELLYITLYELLLDALASEHGARLAATRSAESWLDERTDLLRRHLAAARREASTQEVIEIAAGARARKT